MNRRRVSLIAFAVLVASAAAPRRRLRGAGLHRPVAQHHVRDRHREAVRDGSRGVGLPVRATSRTAPFEAMGAVQLIRSGKARKISVGNDAALYIGGYNDDGSAGQASRAALRQDLEARRLSLREPVDRADLPPRLTRLLRLARVPALLLADGDARALDARGVAGEVAGADLDAVAAGAQAADRDGVGALADVDGARLDGLAGRA